MLNDKGYEVLDSLATSVAFSPEFKIFNSIIAPDTVFMMDSFKFSQIASDVFLHYKTMLLDVSMSHCLRVSWGGLEYVSARSLDDAALPPMGLFTSMSSHPLIGTLLRAKLLTIFITAMFGVTPDGIRRAFKFNLAKVTDKFNPSPLPGIMGFPFKLFCPPFPIAGVVAEKMLGIIRPIVMYFKFFPASLAHHVYHPLMIA